MKRWITDRPDLERRASNRKLARRLAELLDVEEFQVVALLRSVAANPTIDAAAIVADALSNRTAARDISGRLFDLMLERIAELVSIIAKEVIADELRTIEASKGGGREDADDDREPDDLDRLDAELQAGAGRGDAWEGDDR